MRIYKAIAGAGLLTILATSAHALDATVPFTGVVLSTCVLTVGTPGLMAAGTDFTTLSSTNSGGTPGTIAVLSTGTNFKVSAIA
ncbi:MAG: hypothetical protein ACRCS9_08105, partial [Hyphomicrobium sp.]